MKLFINSGVCERIWNGENVKIKQTIGKSQLCLSIPNYLEDKKKQEDINFVFNIEGINKESLEEDLLLENISLQKTSKNSYRIDSYNIDSSKKTSERYMYALIRSNASIPDDVFIPSYMKDKVTVLRRIRFIDTEADYGDFLSNVYLIKINLGWHESIPIYLASENPYVLRDHYVLYKLNSWNGEYCISEKLETFIYIDKYNKNQYISLSELCN